MIDHQLAVEAALAEQVNKHHSGSGGNGYLELSPAVHAMFIALFQELANQQALIDSKQQVLYLSQCFVLLKLDRRLIVSSACSFIVLRNLCFIASDARYASDATFSRAKQTRNQPCL